MLPPHELYAQKQLRHNLGYALFEPDPCGSYDRVRVGDVGYIEEGSFVRLFNAFHDADALENVGADLPELFQPVEERFRRLRTFQSLSERVMVSQSVRELRGEGVINTAGYDHQLRVIFIFIYTTLLTFSRFLQVT